MGSQFIGRVSFYDGPSFLHDYLLSFSRCYAVVLGNLVEQFLHLFIRLIKNGASCTGVDYVLAADV